VPVQRGPSWRMTILTEVVTFLVKVSQKTGWCLRPVVCQCGSQRCFANACHPAQGNATLESQLLSNLVRIARGTK